MPTDRLRLAFVGSGIMGGVIVRRLVDAGSVKAEDIVCSDTDPAKPRALQQDLGVSPASSNAGAVRGASQVWVCVPPPDVVPVLAEVASALDADALVVSVAAGVSLEAMAAALPDGIGHCRVMPNTPSLVGRGFNGVCYGAISEEQRAEVERLLTALGDFVELPEDQFNAFCALCAVGPTYICPVMDALAQAAASQGLDAQLAQRAAAAVVAGSGLLAAETDRSPDDLKDMISLQTLDEPQARRLFTDAFGAALARLDALQAKLGA